MREKYRAISSVVGGERRIRPVLPAAPSPSPSTAGGIADAVEDAPGSETDEFGRKVAARGADE